MMLPKYKVGDQPFVVAQMGEEWCIINVEIVSVYCRLGKRTKKPSIMGYFVKMLFGGDNVLSMTEDIVYMHEPNLWQTFESAVNNQSKLSSWYTIDWKKHAR